MADLNSKITLRLLIDAGSDKVLFGEAGKDFVDFMFSLLTVPLGSVIKLLSAPSMIGSIGKHYQSDKTSLLQPKVSTSYVTNHLLLDTKTTVVIKYYICNYCNRKITTVKNTLCPNCKQVMVNEASFVFPSGSTEHKCYLCANCKSKVTTVRNTMCPKCNCAMVTEVALVVPSGSASLVGAGNAREGVGGLVKGLFTYMIADDLEVTLMSAISSITFINHFIMKKDVQLEEKVVAVGMEEGLALLKASLDSPTALTDVFCSPKKKEKPPSSSIVDGDDD
ncbi:uncharacterized protein LOC110116216 [Dendrobium catenatum]|uniref:uncharacterized protein LOC110116216 n=1 Tax=Dendrobium catenatum TaxID=906689 RepID=UPI0009F53D48|nr:uncharacterized protein LOC110116216 [Dendrobium catenatum]